MADPLLLPFHAPSRFDPGRPVIRISPGGTRVFVASDQYEEWGIVLDVPSRQPLREFPKLGRGARAHFLDEDRLVLFSEERNTVYDLAAGRELAWDGDPIPGGDGWRGPRPNLLFTGGDRFALYDTAARKKVRNFSHLLQRSVTSVGLSPDGRSVAAEFCEKNCRCTPLVGIWDVDTGRCLRIYEIFSENECHDIALSSAGLFAVCTNGFVDVFGPDHAESIVPSKFSCIAQCLRFSPSGRVLTVVEFDGAVAWIDPLTGQALMEKPAPADPPLSGCSVNENGLAAGVSDLTLLVWQLPHWEGADLGPSPEGRGEVK